MLTPTPNANCTTSITSEARLARRSAVSLRACCAGAGSAAVPAFDMFTMPLPAATAANRRLSRPALRSVAAVEPAAGEEDREWDQPPQPPDRPDRMPAGCGRVADSTEHGHPGHEDRDHHQGERQPSAGLDRGLRRGPPRQIGEQPVQVPSGAGADGLAHPLVDLGHLGPPALEAL